LADLRALSTRVALAQRQFATTGVGRTGAAGSPAEAVQGGAPPPAGRCGGKDRLVRPRLLDQTVIRFDTFSLNFRTDADSTLRRIIALRGSIPVRRRCPTRQVPPAPTARDGSAAIDP
jgi:hypothetical protein